jgi:hypothetical protein
VGPTASTTKVEEGIDGGPPVGHYQKRPPPSLEKTSMADPLGALPVGLVAATTEAEEDVDDGGAADRFSNVHHRG